MLALFLYIVFVYIDHDFLTLSEFCFLITEIFDIMSKSTIETTAAQFEKIEIEEDKEIDFEEDEEIQIEEEIQEDSNPQGVYHLTTQIRLRQDLNVHFRLLFTCNFGAV